MCQIYIYFQVHHKQLRLATQDCLTSQASPLLTLHASCLFVFASKFSSFPHLLQLQTCLRRALIYTECKKVHYWMKKYDIYESFEINSREVFHKIKDFFKDLTAEYVPPSSTKKLIQYGDLFRSLSY